MKAVIIKSGIPVYTDFELASLQTGWVRIKVEYAGLCGSDLHKIKAFENSSLIHAPMILGHEFTGVVAKINEKEQRLHIGQHIAGIPLLPCHTCDKCREGMDNLCFSGQAIGRTTQGSFAQYVDIPIANVRQIPFGLSLKTAVLADVLAVCLHAINMAEISEAKSNCLVIGDGAVGCILSFLLTLQGANVTLLGKNRQNLSFMHSIGKITNSDDFSSISTSFKFTFETVGRSQPQTLELAVHHSQPQGKIIVLGVFAPKYYIPLLGRELFIKETILKGSNSYLVNDFDKALEILAEYEKVFSRFITHILPLSDFNHGISLMHKKQGRTIKIVFHP